jgi:hypothetical protein
MAQARKLVVVGGLLLLIGVLFAPAAAGRLLGNLGWLALRDQMIAQGRRLTDYPRYQVVDQPSIPAIQDWLERAIAVSGEDRTLHWQLGRLALAAGEIETAARWLAPLTRETRYNELLNRDRLAALSLAGRDVEVLASVTQQPPNQLLPRPVQAAIDRQALAYLQQDELGALEKARSLRPSDLYVNFRLWQHAHTTGDQAAAESYRQAITRFKLEAIDPAEEGLLTYVATVIPELRTSGLWDRELTRRVMAFLAWRHFKAAAVEPLLNYLADYYPAENEWRALLEELHQRQSGQAQESFGEIPGDDERADLQIAAEELGVSIDRIGLGPELVTNGNFEEWGAPWQATAQPVGWQFYQYGGSRTDEGLYVAGQDGRAGNEPVARIDAVWGGDAGDGTRTFGEYIGGEFPVSNQPYLVSVVYRSHFELGGLLLLVGDYFSSAGEVIVNEGLPDTAGQWRIVRFMADGPSRQVAVRPVLRNWGVGQAGIKDVSVRGIRINE